MKLKLLALSLFFTHSTFAGTAELEAALDKFCGKMKICIKQEMQKEMGDNIPPQMQEMMDQMSSKMCMSFREDVMPDDVLVGKQDFVDAGTQCMQDLMKIPCDQFEAAKEPASCKRAKELGKKYSQ